MRLQISLAFIFFLGVNARKIPHTRALQSKLFQPTTVLTVDAHPATLLYGSLSMPQGSPWCNGMPTFWMVGHQAFNETPWCLVPKDGTTSFSNYNFANATFVQPKTVVLDVNDANNAQKGRLSLDRHDCIAIDLNKDGVPDIVCAVGALKGTGYGYIEVYLTNANNTVTKILDGRGLHKFPTTRNRLLATLIEKSTGATLLVVAAEGVPRADGQPNVHRMFRLRKNATSLSAADSFFFDYVPGPWEQHTKFSGLLTADVNKDGIDDFIMCNENSPPFIFMQSSSSTWKALPVTGATVWDNVRVADVTGDGIPDIVAVGPVSNSPESRSWLKVFRGKRAYPYFDFRATPYYAIAPLPYNARDVEMLDVNNDGITDIYIAQSNATKGSPCAFNYDTPFEEDTIIPSYVPPLDLAPDLLLIGMKPASNKPLFQVIKMQHALPGCGYLLKRFGNGRTMILAQGTPGYLGHSILLQW